MKRLRSCTVPLLLLAAVITSHQPPAQAGSQTMIARLARSPVVIDGVLVPAEGSAAVPVHVTANQPGGPPGVVPWFITPPANPDDLSFTIYAQYDQSNLYVA